MSGHKAIFFDRDGVINHDLSYVYKREDFAFYEDFFSCAQRFYKQGYKLIVVTNQSGIERGYYTTKDFLNLSAYMQDMMRERVGFIMDRIYFCPFLHDTIRRKPAGGMMIQAQNELGIDLAQSCLVGDRMSDVEAAYNAGITRRYLLCRTNLPKDSQTKSESYPDSHKIDSRKSGTMEYEIIRTLDLLQP